MTVKDLYEKCKDEIDAGKGDNEVVLCVNENEFHSLNTGFSSPVYNDSEVNNYLKENDLDEDDVSILN
ncbi:MAG: hypothetical protein J5929_01965 [Eubacterium sp.]|nr:hypothetical protein [Eubacterium sp.]